MAQAPPCLASSSTSSSSSSLPASLSLSTQFCPGVHYTLSLLISERLDPSPLCSHPFKSKHFHHLCCGLYVSAPSPVQLQRAAEIRSRSVFTGRRSHQYMSIRSLQTVIQAHRASGKFQNKTTTNS